MQVCTSSQATTPTSHHSLIGNHVRFIEFHNCQWVKVTFAVLNLCNTHNLGNIVCFNSVYLHMTWKAHPACDLNIIVKGEGLLKGTGSRTLENWKCLGNGAR